MTLAGAEQERETNGAWTAPVGAPTKDFSCVSQYIHHYDKIHPALWTQSAQEITTSSQLGGQTTCLGISCKKYTHAVRGEKKLQPQRVSIQLAPKRKTVMC